MKNNTFISITYLKLYSYVCFRKVVISIFCRHVTKVNVYCGWLIEYYVLLLTLTNIYQEFGRNWRDQDKIILTAPLKNSFHGFHGLTFFLDHTAP